jgi:hypothetical protein
LPCALANDPQGCSCFSSGFSWKARLTSRVVAGRDPGARYSRHCKSLQPTVSGARRNPSTVRNQVIALNNSNTIAINGRGECALHCNRIAHGSGAAFCNFRNASSNPSGRFLRSIPDGKAFLSTNRSPVLAMTERLIAILRTRCEIALVRATVGSPRLNRLARRQRRRGS